MLELARTGRLRETAARLKVDETTVSRRVARLEKNLGTRPIRPARRRMSAHTESGHLLLPHAEAIESEALRARESLSPGAGELTGTVRILTTDGFGAYVLIPVLGRLMSSHPTSTSRS